MTGSMNIIVAKLKQNDLGNMTRKKINDKLSSTNKIEIKSSEHNTYKDNTYFIEDNKTATI